MSDGLFSAAEIAEERVLERGLGVDGDIVGAHFSAGGINAFRESVDAIEVGGSDGLGINAEHLLNALEVFEPLEALERKREFFLG